MLYCSDKRLLYGLDPTCWTKFQVKEWLSWMAKEHSLKNLDYKRFANTDGNKLCQMTMRDLCRITAKTNADVILNQMATLKQSKF